MLEEEKTNPELESTKDVAWEVDGAALLEVNAVDEVEGSEEEAWCVEEETVVLDGAPAEEERPPLDEMGTVLLEETGMD